MRNALRILVIVAVALAFVGVAAAQTPFSGIAGTGGCTGAESERIPRRCRGIPRAPGGGPGQLLGSQCGRSELGHRRRGTGTAASGYSGLPLASRFEAVEDRATGESLQVRGGTSDNRSFDMWFRPTRPAGGHQLVLESGGMPVRLDDATVLF